MCFHLFNGCLDFSRMNCFILLKSSLLIFVYHVKNFILFLCRYPTVPALFVEETVFPLLNCVSCLVKNQLIQLYGTNFETKKYEFSNLLSSFSRVFPLTFHVNFRISMSVGHGFFSTTQVILCIVRVPNYQYGTMYVCVCSAQSCLTLCSFVDCSPPGSSVHGIFQTRILGRLPLSTPYYPPNPGIEAAPFASPALADRFFTTREALTWG